MKAAVKVEIRRAGTWALGLLGAVVVVSIWCAWVKSGVALEVMHQVRSTLHAWFFAALVLLSLKPTTHLVARIFHSGVLRFFGRYSYGLYVYHGMLTWYFIEKQTHVRVEEWAGSHGLGMALYAGLGLGVSLLVAVLSYELFEKRFLRLKRFFEARPAAKIPSAASASKG